MTMHVITKKRTSITYTVKHKLQLTPPDFDKERGLRYWPDMDEVAAWLAGTVFDAATSAIRTKMKVSDAPVALQIEFRGQEIWAVFSSTRVTTE